MRSRPTRWPAARDFPSKIQTWTILISGLMIFARDESIQAALQQNWKSVVKRYLAIVERTLSNAQGTLKDHLVESRSLWVHRVDQGGALAITHYRVLENYGDKSLLELTLDSGRKHQIRVQLAARGHPIVGDVKYGARIDPARRLALHSSQLIFRHPVSGAKMEFCSPLPARLRALLDRSASHPTAFAQKKDSASKVARR